MLVDDARDRRHRDLRAEGLSGRVGRAAGRGRSRRRRSLIRVVRDQAGKGADWIKVYGDYRAGPNGQTVPTFSQEEMNADRRDRAQHRPAGRGAFEHARGHAARDHGRRRDHRARRRRHAEVFKLMAEKGVALCPTLAAGHATSQYARLEAGSTARSPQGVQRKRDELQARARRRRDDRRRIRRRRFHARRRGARARADGGVRHDGDRRR